MILYDDRNNVVDYFLNTIKNNKKIGISWSGGTDSTFAFWYMAKCLHDNNLKDHYILPYTGVQYEMRFQPITEMELLYKIITESFPKANILPHHTVDFFAAKDYINSKAASDAKWEEMYNIRDTLYEKNLIDTHVTSACMAPPIEEIDLNEITFMRNKDKLLKENTGHSSAWRLVDKKFIAYQYKKFGLLDTIFPLTSSCVNPDYDGIPCRECAWCKEKNWSFGMIDRGYTMENCPDRTAGGEIGKLM